MGEIYNNFFIDNEQQIALLVDNHDVLKDLLKRALSYHEPLREDMIDWLSNLANSTTMH